MFFSVSTRTLGFKDGIGGSAHDGHPDVDPDEFEKAVATKPWAASQKNNTGAFSTTYPCITLVVLKVNLLFLRT